MRRSFFLIAAAAGCAGIISSEFIHIPSGGWVLVFVLTPFIGLVLPKRWRIVSLFVVAFFIGWWRFALWLQPGTHGLEQTINQPTPFVGVVLDRRSDDHGQQLTVRQLISRDRKLAGGIQLQLPPWPAISIGRQLTFFCIPSPWPAKNFWRQRSHDVRAWCDQVKIRANSEVSRNWRLMLARIETGVIETVSKNFTDPQAGFLNGILIGRIDSLAPEVVQDFRLTGTSHLVALSGFNVTIMIAAANVVFVRLFGRRVAWIPALGLLVSFVVMTGASASVVRAAIMATLTLLAGSLGRPVSMVRLLGYTLVLMVWFNPIILLHDLGFQLSFLATIGLVGLSKPLSQKLFWVPETFGLREGFATTLGAILMTEPLLVWSFGRLSLIAPLVNVLVLPLMPLTMAAGALALIVPVARPPADMLLRVILGIIHTGATLPLASITPPPLIAATVIAGLCAVTIRIILYEKKSLASR